MSYGADGGSRIEVDPTELLRLAADQQPPRRTAAL